MKVTHVMVGSECTRCVGEGSYDNGESRYFECEVCEGSGIMSTPMPLADFAKLMASDDRSPAKAGDT